MVSSIAPELALAPERFFVPQFASAEGVEQTILNRSTADFNTPEWNWCGMCCLRMILLAISQETPSLLELYERAFEYGVYQHHEGRVIGAYHRALANFIKQEFQLESRVERRMSAGRIVQLVQEGSFVIASVSAEIRKLTGPLPETKSGHFVLVYGIHIPNSHQEPQIILHNSAGFQSLGTQSHVHVPITRFMDCFSGNGIFIRP